MKSRLPGFYKMTIDERLALLRDRELISEDEWQMLRGSEQVLSNIQADNMVENVIGVFGLPMGLGLNFLVNGQDYAVPLVVGRTFHRCRVKLCGQDDACRWWFYS